MSTAPKATWPWWLLGAAVVLGVATYLGTQFALQEPAEPAPPGEVPPPSYSETRYRNAKPGAEYIGTAACAGCHKREHQSYLLTAHSRALSDLDPAAEPPDAAFDHAPSGRSYRVYRADGQLRHEEVVRTPAGEEMARLDLPVRYLIGSGNFCRSYLVEVDGFLHESPLTYYTAKKQWGMSPGYDFPHHGGFERPIRAGCLACHAGRFETGDTVHRVAFHEKAIGCENCHGPGSLHRDRHLAGKFAPGEPDDTIVHPGNLPRALREAVCAACHLNGAASVLHRGRQATDYRPGRPLSDYRTDYRLADGDGKMTVVGHVEQLRRSACYQKSPQMTCLTCHDPHQREAPKDLVAFRRGQCLDCHERQPCSVPEPERRRQKPGDNCVACHMPTGDTDIPHLAFTHHRIGKHAAAAPPVADGPTPELVAIDGTAGLAPADRDRGLGLAYLDLSRDPQHARHEEAYWARARQHLEAAHAAGLRDAALLQGLAELYWKRDLARAVEYGRAALAAPDATPRATARLIVADAAFQRGHYAAARSLLEALTRERRFAEDWRLLGVSYLELGDTPRALTTLEAALAIRPYRHTTHLALAEAHRRLGDRRNAEAHFRKAQWLAEHRQD